LARRQGVVLALVALACLAGILYIDRPLAVLVGSWDGSTIRRFNWLSQLGHGTLPIVAATGLYVLFRFALSRPAAALRCLYVGSALVATSLFINTAKILFGRARPLLFLRDDVYGFDFFRLPADWRSFPSGHAGTIFVIACCLSIIVPRFRVPLFAVAAIVALARLGAGEHYFSDAVVGGYVAIVISLALTRFFDPDGVKLPVR